MRRFRAATAAILLVLLPLTAGCRDDRGRDAADDDPGPGPGVSHGRLTVDGRERTYRLYVPASLPDGPVPLFVALHGGGGSADRFAGTNHVEDLADEEGFVVVHPDGVDLGSPRRDGGVWNGGVCCGPAARDGVDDVAFVAALVDRIAGDRPIDPARVHAFGHSNGGIMSYRLACELADRIAGIGVVAGTLGVEGCRPSRPVSVVHVHGDADRHVPIQGGAGPDSVAGVDFPPPRDGFAVLAAGIGCPPPADAERTTPGDGDLTVEDLSCDDGTAARFVTIAGADHPWPGGTGRPRRRAGDTYAGYDATAELVDFLLAHPRG